MILLHYHVQDILLDFTSIAQWLKDNWYWVLAGFGALSECTIESYTITNKAIAWV